MGKRSRMPKETGLPAPPSNLVLKTAFRQTCLWIVLSLVLITAVAYAPARFCAFVNYDDNDYVTGNLHVKDGLTWDGLAWAFTTGDAANWHPLTWLSHMLDVQLYGLNPEPHHLTNVGLHLATTLLLFWVLVQLTKAPVPSGMIAALFAVHPLHVESVAWVAERKDVLSTFLWMLTLLAYIRYVRQPSRLRFLVILGLFAAGLMAKPMLVTLPFVLLLLDFWPLRRWTFDGRAELPALIREKIPLLMLAMVSSIVTFLVQQRGRAVIGLDKVPIANRFENAFLSYVIYIKRMVWPRGLSVLYPVVRPVSNWWIVAALAVVLLSILAVRFAERLPYFAVGWFWYLGTLVPVIGLVQVGKQASADRYTYVPLVGLFLIIAFGVYDAFQRLPLFKPFCLAASFVTIVACIWLTREQLQYWRTSQTLWAHALALDNENASAHVNIGSYLEKEGELDQAIFHYKEAVRIEPEMAIAHSNLGAALENRGELDGAIYHFSEALRIGPEAADWDFNLGNALSKSGQPNRLNEAIDHLNLALRLKHDFPEAHNGLGICYLTEGQLDKAVAEFSEALRLKPDYASAHNNLATAFGELGRISDAISEYRAAVRLDPNYADAHENLGILLVRQGQLGDALDHFSAALRINPQDDVARNWLAQISASRAGARRN